MLNFSTWIIIMTHINLFNIFFVFSININHKTIMSVFSKLIKKNDTVAQKQIKEKNLFSAKKQEKEKKLIITIKNYKINHYKI